MATLFKWLFVLLVMMVAGLLGALLLARQADGPWGPFPGGALRAGALVTEPVEDWSFVPVGEIALQLDGEARSRTVWMVADGDRAYVPASISFPPNKTWHQRAALHGAALIRAQGKRYPVQLTRLSAASDAFASADRRLAENGATPPGAGYWIFSVTSRPHGN